MYVCACNNVKYCKKEFYVHDLNVRKSSKNAAKLFLTGREACLPTGVEREKRALNEAKAVIVLVLKKWIYLWWSSRRCAGYMVACENQKAVPCLQL